VCDTSTLQCAAFVTHRRVITSPLGRIVHHSYTSSLRKYSNLASITSPSYYFSIVTRSHFLHHDADPIISHDPHTRTRD
jgi:hypothetical protein